VFIFRIWYKRDYINVTTAGEFLREYKCIDDIKIGSMQASQLFSFYLPSLFLSANIEVYLTAENYSLHLYMDVDFTGLPVQGNNVDADV
jgi:hypothetical protein